MNEAKTRRGGIWNKMEPDDWCSDDGGPDYDDPDNEQDDLDNLLDQIGMYKNGNFDSSNEDEYADDRADEPVWYSDDGNFWDGSYNSHEDSEQEYNYDESDGYRYVKESRPEIPEADKNMVLTRSEDGLVVYKENIGTGAFGSVHRADYKNEKCAAKILSEHAKNMMMMIDDTSSIQDAARDAFQKECSFLEKLQHENIIRHITTAIEPKSELPIIVMELMDCSLKKFIADKRPLDLKLQLTICHGISRGLHYLHTKDIIHRDLCDDNVLLKQESELIVKISDFGMSKILKYESKSVTMTAVGHRRGYLPPESFSSDSSSESEEDNKKIQYSHRLDIYSFGAVATQTVKSANQFTRRKHLKRTFKAISTDHPLQSIIASCIERDSKLRPQANAVSKQIATVLESLKTEDLSPQASENAKKSISKSLQVSNEEQEESKTPPNSLEVEQNQTASKTSLESLEANHQSPETSQLIPLHPTAIEVSSEGSSAEESYSSVQPNGKKRRLTEETKKGSFEKKKRKRRQ